MRGADSNRRGPKKVAPLASALEIACEDDTSLFDLLVEYGAKIEPSLFFDVIRPRVVDGQFKTKFLLSKDLDPTTTSPEWATPLHCAAYFAKEEVVKILLDTGADSSETRANRRWHRRESSILLRIQICRLPLKPYSGFFRIISGDICLVGFLYILVGLRSLIPHICTPDDMLVKLHGVYHDYHFLSIILKNSTLKRDR